jgi:hypothetical protein
MFPLPPCYQQLTNAVIHQQLTLTGVEGCFHKLFFDFQLPDFAEFLRPQGHISKPNHSRFLNPTVLWTLTPLRSDYSTNICKGHLHYSYSKTFSVVATPEFHSLSCASRAVRVIVYACVLRLMLNQPKHHPPAYELRHFINPIGYVNNKIESTH